MLHKDEWEKDIVKEVREREGEREESGWEGVCVKTWVDIEKKVRVGRRGEYRKEGTVKKNKKREN